MAVWTDHWGDSIRVTEERLAHILEHPEMAGEESRIAEALAQPDLVIQSASDKGVRLYYRFYQTSAIGAKHLCAVVKWGSDGPFLITAYFTDRPKRGTLLWTTSE